MTGVWRRKGLLKCILNRPSEALKVPRLYLPGTLTRLAC
jgi:hypothetical protein